LYDLIVLFSNSALQGCKCVLRNQLSVYPEMAAIAHR